MSAPKVRWTPGPWRTGGTTYPGTERATMNVWGPTAPGMQSGQMVAKDALVYDARLIAAAPEMYEALLAVAVTEGVIELALSRHEDLRQKIDTALAKAHGGVAL